jgi:hypothetical protein
MFSFEFGFIAKKTHNACRSPHELRARIIWTENCIEDLIVRQPFHEMATQTQTIFLDKIKTRAEKQLNSLNGGRFKSILPL